MRGHRRVPGERLGLLHRHVSVGERLAVRAALFQSLRVERTSDGGVRIDAPPEAAESLIALFDGMAKLLASIAGPIRETSPRLRRSRGSSWR